MPKFSALIRTTEREFYDDDTGVHYAMARYLCYWLQEKGLLIKFVAKAQANKAVDPTGWKALEEVLGVDPDSLQNDWSKFVLGLKKRS